MVKNFLIKSVFIFNHLFLNLSYSPALMKHSHIEIWTHVVISAKEYRPLFRTDWVPTIDTTVQDFVNSIPDQRGTFCILPDHVHLLVKLPDDMSVNDMVSKIKSSISERLINTFEDAADFEWEEDFHAHSVSLNRLSVEKNLIERQEIKHKEISLQEELKFFGM